MKRIVLFILWLASALLPACAQSDTQLVREGNRLYAQGKYAQAEVSYRKAIEAQPDNGVARYNLGCALQKQQKDPLALEQYEQAAQTLTSKKRKSQAYHNMGTVLQRKHEYDKAIDAYKNALRLNPQDEHARYNYALCKHQLKQQQQQKSSGQQRDKNDKNNQNKNKQQNQRQQDKQNDKKQKQQNSQERMSKQNAEQLLNAAVQQEQQTQQRLKRSMRQSERKKLDKNW